jgi:hypothetical protein
MGGYVALFHFPFRFSRNSPTVFLEAYSMRKHLLFIFISAALVCAMVNPGVAEPLVDQNTGNMTSNSNHSLPVHSGTVIADIDTDGLSPMLPLEIIPTENSPPETGEFQSPAGAGMPVTQWLKCVGGTSQDWGYSVQQTLDGGYVIAGTTASANGDLAGAGYHGGSDAFVAKLNSAGTVQWARCVGGTNNDLGSWVRQTADGGYLLAGYATAGDGDMTGIYHGGGDAFVAKLSPEGSLVWIHCVGGTNEDHEGTVQFTSDNGCILTGYTLSSDGDMMNAGFHTGSSAYVYDAFAAKLTSLGVVSWVRCVGGTGSEYGKSIQQTADGGYILAGSTGSSNGDMTYAGNHGGGDAFLAKLNSGGTVTWVKCIGGTLSDGGKSIQQTSDGGYVLTGATQSSDGDMMSAGYYGGYNNDAFVAKMNSAGTPQWVRCIGGAGYDEGDSVLQTSGGDYVLAGYTDSSNGAMTGAGYHGGGDAFMAKLNSPGAFRWVRCIGGSASEYGYSIQQTADGGYVLGGYTSSSDGDMNGAGYHSGPIDAFVARFCVPGTIGVFLNGQWYMDAMGNGVWEGQPPDRTTSFGIPGDTPVVGDWDRDTVSEIGVFRNGQWHVDFGGRNYLWDGEGIDRVFNFGFAGAIPVTGDWNGDTILETGIFSNGIWYLDANSNNAWDGTGSGKDAAYTFGFSGAVPVVGDWDRDGYTEIGVYSAGSWYVDYNGNYKWDGTTYCGIGCGEDEIYNFGAAGFAPVTGDWNSDGIREIGAFNAGAWYLDTNGNNQWDGTGTGKDGAYTFGAGGFTPVVGDWT